MRTTIIGLFAVLFPFLGFSMVSPPDTVLPKVFLIGEYEKSYEKAANAYNTMLLTACNDDINKAYDKWISMIQEMEAYSNLIQYDLKGIKLWLHVFWDSKGKIDHIAFHLKPNSKLVDTQELKGFFASFINHYVFPLRTSSDYSHYGSASFPTTPKPIANGYQSGGLPSPEKNLAKDPSNRIGNRSN